MSIYECKHKFFSGTLCIIYIYRVRWPALMRKKLEWGNLGKSFQAQGKYCIVLAENKSVGHKSEVNVQMNLSKDSVRTVFLELYFCRWSIWDQVSTLGPCLTFLSQVPMHIFKANAFLFNIPIDILLSSPERDSKWPWEKEVAFS